MTTPRRIILLTGPPGAGKTTVADLLSRRSPEALAAHVRTDDFYSNIKKGWIAPWRPESHAQNLVMVEAMIASAVAYARGGYEVVMDGIATDWVKQAFVEAAQREALVLDFVVLLPDLATAAQRARDRTHDPLPDYAPYEVLYGLFAREPARHTLDSRDMAPEALAVEIRAGIAAGRFALPAR